MSPSFSPRIEDCDRYLIVDDTDDNITEILTVICDGLPPGVCRDGGVE